MVKKKVESKSIQRRKAIMTQAEIEREYRQVVRQMLNKREARKQVIPGTNYLKM